MAKKGSKRSTMATHGHTMPKPATAAISIKNSVSGSYNETTAPATTPTVQESVLQSNNNITTTNTVTELSLRHTFAKFLEIADAETIKNLLATAAYRSQECENLKLLWDRAFDEGYIRAQQKCDRKVEDSYDSGYNQGLEEGKSQKYRSFQMLLEQGKADERLEWVTAGHGSHCFTSTVVLENNSTQTEPLASTVESRSIQTKSPAPISEIGTQTDLLTHSIDVGTQIELPPSIFGVTAHIPTLLDDSDSPWPSRSGNAIGYSLAPFLVANTSSLSRNVVNTSLSSSLTVFEPETRPSIVSNQENTSNTKYFAKKQSQNAKSDNLLPPTHAESKWNVRSEDATSPTPSPTVFEAPISPTISKPPDFDEKLPEKANLATSTPPTISKVDASLRPTNAVTDSLSTSICNPSKPSETTPIPQKSPKTTKFFENHPKIFKTATSSPENGPPKPTNATAIFVSQKPIPFTNTPLPNSPKITKNLENHPKTPKSTTSSPENGSQMRMRATAGSISQPSVPIVIIPPPNPPKFTHLNQKSPETPNSNHFLHNTPELDSLRPTNIDSTHSERSRASKTGNFIKKSPQNAKSYEIRPKISQSELLRLDLVVPTHSEHSLSPKCEYSFPKNQFSPISSNTSARKFNWADEPCDLDSDGSTPVPKFAPRDLSVLHSGSNPWRSLQNHRGRRRNQKFRPRKTFYHSYPSMFDSFNPHQCQPPPLPLPKNPVSLDWERDPRLSDLSQALQALGWFRR